ncbi:MAG: L-fucokinase [Phycisphaerae bacterium]|nr:L-fucokinase [Phycisphaerae bacterium]
MEPDEVDVVVTAARPAQARVYESLLRERVRDGRMPRGVHCRVVSDPGGRRVGSGVATALAILKVAGGRKDIANALRGRRVLIIHSGGDSRRLPAFAAVGKAFAPLPGRGGSPPFTVFDAVLEDLLALPRSDDGDIIVASGDTVVGASAWCPSLDSEGVVGIGQPGTLARGGRHGVYVVRRGDRVARFLQKPSPSELRQNRAILASGKVFIDTGIVRFSPDAAEVLARAIHPLTVEAIKGAIEAVDLYRHVLQALVAGDDLDGYVSRLDVGLLNSTIAVRRALWSLAQGMSTVPFSMRAIGGRGFTHAGSTSEYLALAQRSLVNLIGSERCAVRSAPGMRHVVVGSLEARLVLAGDNLVVGAARALGRVTLPRGIGCVVLPIAPRGFSTVLFHAHDDAKTALDAGGTIFGQSLARWCTTSGLDSSDVVPTGASLWEARLWTVSARPSIAQWMVNGDRAPSAWRSSRRLSLSALLERVDAERLLELDRAISRVVVMGNPAGILDDDALGVEALRVRAIDRAGRNAVARQLAISKGTALQRSRFLACAARITQADQPARSKKLLGAAFAAIGEAVATRVDLPRRPPTAALRFDEAAWASAPARIDLAGGWSDTPPICFERGGTVVNVAIALDGRPPVHAIAKLSDEPVIALHSVDLGRTRVIRESAEVCQHTDPNDWTALAKAALVLAGVAPPSADIPMKRWLSRFGGGLSLSLFAAVPKGSGLGTSSILGATTLACLDRVVGRATQTRDLIERTSVLEQMIATRGGWQDQVGGLVGGFKLLRTSRGPMQIPDVISLPASDRFVAAIDGRAVLCFTGFQRMARNILQRVVERYLVRDGDALRIIARLRAGAEDMSNAIRSGDVGSFCGLLSEYWRLKTSLDPNATTPAIEAMVRPFGRLLDAWTMPGAGGGGFVFLIARDRDAAQQIRERLTSHPVHPRSRVVPFAFTPRGLEVSVL